jgi:dTDP-4-dehydrorhamnose reductase
MTQALITGMNGTVAPATAERLRRAGLHCIAWDRARVSPDQPEAVRQHLREVRPDFVLHFAMGSPDWAAVLAGESLALGSRFFFSSTVSVFDNRQPGPYAPERAPDAQDDYGRYKAECERRILAANPSALIARLGWQIGHVTGNNNMLDFLVRTGAERGRVELSSGMLHSHAFLEDTADAICRLIGARAEGLYQLEGNPGLSMFEVARRLAKLHRLPYPVVPIDDPPRDARMLDGRIEVAPITGRLPE